MKIILKNIITMALLIILIISNTVFAQSGQWVLERFTEEYSDLAYQFFIYRESDCTVVSSDGADEEETITACFFYLTREETFAITLMDEEGDYIITDDNDVTLNCYAEGVTSQIEMYCSDYKRAFNPVDRSKESFAATDIYTALQNESIIELELCFEDLHYSFTLDCNGFSSVYAEYDEARIIHLEDLENESDLMINAIKAWSVGKVLGFTDEQCAGMLGNMHTEGGIDPYRIECDYAAGCNHYYKWCGHKNIWMKHMNTYTERFVFYIYELNEISLNHDFYRSSRYGAACGVGLCGFTGVNYDALVDYARAAGVNWYDKERALDVQLAFIIGGSERGGYAAGDWLKNWGKDPIDDIDEAAYLFNVNFEGNASDFCGDLRREYAHDWYRILAGTAGNPDYGQKIVELSLNTVVK